MTDNIQQLINQAFGKGSLPASLSPRQVAQYGVGNTERNFVMPNPFQAMAQFEAMEQVQQNFVTPETLNGVFSPARFSKVGKQLQMQAFQEHAHERMMQLQQHRTQLNAPPLSTLPVEAFLREAFIEGKVIDKMSPSLLWLDLATRFTTTSKEIVWFRHKFSADNDPKIFRPQPIRPGAVFPRTLVSDPERQFASVGQWGIAIDFTREEMRFTNQAVDSIQRKINAVAYDLTREVNSIYGNELTNNFDETQTGVDADDQVIVEIATNTWDDPNADVLEDIRSLALKMETEDGFFFEATELWVTPTSFKELLDFFTTIDHHWTVNPLTGEIVRRVDNISIRKAPEGSGIPDGKAVMLARGAGVDPVLTVWDTVDNEFTRTGILHTQTFRDNETLTTTVKLWKEFAVVNRNPKAVGLLSGI